MSKPVTNVEIEDVLSSIRRLVSTSDRVEREEQKTDEDVPDKLVLTPSLRVDDAADDIGTETDETVEEQGAAPVTADDAVTADDTAEPETEELPEQGDLASDDEFLQFVAKSAEEDDEPLALDDAISDSDSDALQGLEEILSKDSENSMDIVEDLDVADGAEASGVDLVDGSPEASDNTPGEADLSGDDDADNLRRRAAEFEAIIARKEDRWDPDGTTPDENAAVSGGPVPWQDQDEPDADKTDAEGEELLVDPLSVFDRVADEPEEDETNVDTDEPATEITDEKADVSEPSREDEQTESAAESDETAVTEPAGGADVKDDEAEPERAEETEDAELFESEPAAFAFRSHTKVTPPDVQDTLTEQTAADSLEDAPLAMDEALLDEEALRDMVSDIVRQELQGALGERITRNVRKLVRREIHRALASQDLD